MDTIFKIFRDTILSGAVVLREPVNANDAVNKGYVDALPFLKGPSAAVGIINHVPVFSSTLANEVVSTPVVINSLGDVSGVKLLTVNDQATFGAIYMSPGTYVTLNSPPLVDTHAANKQYVDDQIQLTSITKIGTSVAQSLVRWFDTGNSIDQSAVPALLDNAGLLTAETLSSRTTVQLSGANYLAYANDGFTGTPLDPKTLLLGPTQYNGGGAPENNILVGARVGKQPFGTPAFAASANDNIFIGNDILSPIGGTQIVNARGNVVVGQQSSNSMKTATFNVIVGYQAGFSVRGAEECVFVGAGAGLNTEGGSGSGARCTYVGRLAGSDNTTGTNNSCVGYNTFTGDNDYCTIVGSSAMMGSNSDNTVLVGSSAYTNVNGSNSVVVGNGASSSHNNAVVLGFGATSHALDSLNVADSVTSWWSAGLDALTTVDSVLTFDTATGQIGRDLRYYSIDTTTFVFDPMVTRLRVAGLTPASGADVVFDTATKEIGYVVSSRKYKRDIKPLAAESALVESVLRLEPVTFHPFSPETDSEQTTSQPGPEGQARSSGAAFVDWGLIAEDVACHVPELVAYDEHGEPASVKYSKLPVLLLAVVKRLVTRVNELEARLGAR